MSALLEVDRINSYYADRHILFDVSLHVNRNAVVALLGRNGAGKTTTLNTLMGFLRPRSGKIVLDGTLTQNLRPHAIAQLGLQLVPESRRVFGSLSVEENRARRAVGEVAGRWDGSGRQFRACASAGAAAVRTCRAASSRCWQLLAR